MLSLHQKNKIELLHVTVHQGDSNHSSSLKTNPLKKSSPLYLGQQTVYEHISSTYESLLPAPIHLYQSTGYIICGSSCVLNQFYQGKHLQRPSQHCLQQAKQKGNINKQECCDNFLKYESMVCTVNKTEEIANFKEGLVSLKCCWKCDRYLGKYSFLFIKKTIYSLLAEIDNVPIKTLLLGEHIHHKNPSPLVQSRHVPI